MTRYTCTKLPNGEFLIKMVVDEWPHVVQTLALSEKQAHGLCRELLTAIDATIPALVDHLQQMPPMPEGLAERIRQSLHTTEKGTDDAVETGQQQENRVAEH